MRVRSLPSADTSAGAEEGQRVVPDQVVVPGLGDVDAGVVIDHRTVGADLDATDRIRHVDDADERDEPGELDVEAGEFDTVLDGAGETAVVEGDVDGLGRIALGVAFFIRALRDADDEVAREADRDRVGLVLGDVQEDVDVVECPGLVSPPSRRCRPGPRGCRSRR